MFPKLSDLTKYQEFVIKSQYPQFHKYLTENYPKELKWTEKLYWYYYKLDKKPICKTCGNPTKFISLTDGYRIYCCKKCAINDTEWRDKKNKTCLDRYGNISPLANINIKNKIKQTCLERYGVENPMQNADVKNKAISTNIEKYGVENPSYSQTIIDKIKRTKETKYNDSKYNNINKIKRTCLERYGVENPSQVEFVKNKKIKSSISVYGTIHPMQSDYVKDKINNYNNERFYKEDPNIIDIYKIPGDLYKTFKCKCPDKHCNICDEKIFTINSHTYRMRKNLGYDTCSIRYNLTNTSYIETFIENILKENNIEYCKHSRQIIPPYELDFFIPSKNIAIECNGIYWHSSEMKNNNYHICKFKVCNEQNIQLISVWEDWIRNKPEIVESILLSKLGLIKNTIYARNCIIKEVDSKTGNDFLNSNHIQGKTNSNIKIGLYYDNELVSIMTFTKKIQNDNIIWNLSRFCNKLNMKIVGGASKLLKYFIKNYKPTQIISYSSNDISNGNLYKTLGFNMCNNITNAYWYIHKSDLKRYHRKSFEKSKLKKLGYDINNMTEFQIMDRLPFYRIYDSGHVKYELNIFEKN